MKKIIKSILSISLLVLVVFGFTACKTPLSNTTIIDEQSIVEGTSTNGGTTIIYGLSSIFAAFDRFKLSFYVAGVSVIVVSVFWLLLYNKAVNDAKSERKLDDENEQIKVDDSEKVYQEKVGRKLLFISIYVLCFCAIGVNLIKDGLTTWVPSILKEEFSMSDSISILLTLNN